MTTEHPATAGRCATCGFLAAFSAGQWLEASPAARTSGTLPTAQIPSAIAGASLACIVQAAALDVEFRTAYRNDPQPQPDATGQLTGGSPARAILEVLQRDRRCPEWFKYQPGFTPQQHVEQLHVLELEQRDRELQVRLAEMERDAQRDSLELARAIKSFTTRWTYAAFILAAFGVILVLLTFLFPENGKDMGRILMDWVTHLWQ